MKKVLLSAGAFAICMAAGAQTYFSEDFSGGTLGQFTSVDNDGDGNEWTAADVTGSINTTDNSAISNSWTSGSGALTPDNLLVSSAIDLTTASGTINLLYKVGNVETTNNWWEEYYDVIVTTSNVTGTITSTTPEYGETLPSGGAMLDRSVDLSAYAGSTVYVTFRHYNCTDENFLVLDDVVVKTLLPDDAAVTALNVAPIVQAGNVDVMGTVTNEGSNTITSFDVTWDDGTGPYTDSYTQTLAPGASYNFTHGTQLAASVGTAYNLDVCVVLTGDGDNANDCMSTSVGVVSSIPTKNTVGEEKTGTWCGWCPRGAVAMEDMEATSTFIGIAVHNGDPMVVSAYDSNIGTYVPGGYPGAGVDRVETGDPTEFPTMHAARINEIAPGNVSVTAVQNGNMMDVTVTADWVMTATGVNYRLGAIITEDNVTGTAAGYAQVNYYDGGGAGALNGAGHDWTTAGDPVPASEMEYDHVARALGDNQIIGATASAVSSITDGGSTSYTYSIAIGSEWELGNCHFIGILSDANTGEILNAASTSTFTGNIGINEVEANSSMSVYPNPSSDLTNIRIELKENADVNIDIVNTLGQVVYTKSSNNVAAGEYYYQVDVADFAAGIYTVRATVNGQVTTSKLSVK
ncbi:MAG: choice-of-anchor J domain-containing protein [Crocinitomicaceae bacterium]